MRELTFRLATQYNGEVCIDAGDSLFNGRPKFRVLTSKDRSRWKKATISSSMLKDKIAKTPVLKYFDPDRPPVIVVYASKWAVSEALLQEHDGIYWHVTFTSRALKPNAINYGMVEKVRLALLYILDIGYTMMVSR